MVHLALLMLMGLLLLVWAVKNRVWELEVTVELPAKAPDEAPAIETRPE